MAPITHLECSKCGQSLSADVPQTVCPKDGGVLYARYDLAAIRKSVSPTGLRGRTCSMWRYAELLPDAEPVSLGEGFTPLLVSREYAKVFIKDEGLNPTGSFKARGLSAAVTMAKHFGLKKLAIPSAGNAAGALAAYAAAAGLEAHIFMPYDTPKLNVIECRELGARVQLIDGLITDCAAQIARRKTQEDWFEMSTLKEPYRLEGKKTLGYELAEQLGWWLPDVILYPTGGGTGLIGMWKAFEEMEALGWIEAKRPRMYSVQASGCAPIVRAFEAGADHAVEFPNAQTRASGLRVPKAIGDFLMLRILRDSGGGAIAIDDDEMIRVTREVGGAEGLFIAPEGAACFAALRSLIDSGTIKVDEQVVVFNTGSGIKYLECYG